MIKILFLKEHLTEKRVAISLEVIKKYQKIGLTILAESQAGATINLSDQQMEAVGVLIVKEVDKAIAEADIIITISNHNFNYNLAKAGAVLVTSFINADNLVIEKFINSQMLVFALEKTPRISRAQSLDILSSQSNLSGYVAVIEGARYLGKALPLMMTAAGTVRAAKVLVLGAGVAGLQAIATAKRLGASVSAFDVRKAAKEQVESLGAKFIEVVTNNSQDQDASGAKFYATEMSEEYKQKQQQVLTEKIAEQDLIIATALIMGSKAPILITEDMVKKMKAGAVIVDVATVGGGNCQLTANNCSNLQPVFTTENQVTIIGYSNFANLVAVDASQLIAKNFYSFVELIVKEQKITINFEDEIFKATKLEKLANI